MNIIRLSFVSVLALLVLVGVTSISLGSTQANENIQNVDENQKSYLRGDNLYLTGKYAEAMDVFMPLARSGHCDAQLMVANLFYGFSGYSYPGVPMDRSKAAEWWTKAANQGHPIAQINVGDFYYQHNDVRKLCSACGIRPDITQAYKWYTLAGKILVKVHPFEENTVQKHLDRILPGIRSRITPEESRRAQKLIDDWRPQPKLCEPFKSRGETDKPPS